MGKRINRNAERVAARHHCRSARAFAVNPSRLPARPSGLWGLTAQRGQAKGPACHQCRTAPARALLETYEEKKCCSRKNVLTREASYKWVQAPPGNRSSRKQPE